MLSFWKNRKRERWRRESFPLEWSAVIRRNVPLAAELTPEETEELRGAVQILVHEKNFEGAGGLEMTDEVRVTIAAHAALLTLGRETDYFPTLYSIIVYPRRYMVPVSEHNEDGTVDEGFDEHLGESWHEGAIVLSWDDVVREGRNTRDGRNVCLHEFAHQLDRESGEVDGVPKLPDSESLHRWNTIFFKEYERHADAVDLGRRTAIDPYGAEHPAEFFAVLVEMFFEQPTVMRRRHRDLYALFRDYFRRDPAIRNRGDVSTEL